MVNQRLKRTTIFLRTTTSLSEIEAEKLQTEKTSKTILKDTRESLHKGNMRVSLY
jgi:hypothetical protein